MRMRRLGHMVLIAHGDLPRRIEECPLRHCQVDEMGVTTCDHIACPHCGIGPPVYLRDDEVFYCEQCATRWFIPGVLPGEAPLLESTEPRKT
jgi:hypothetical protein